MMSTRATSIPGLLQDDDAFGAALGVHHLHIIALEHAGQRVDVANVVVDDQDLRPPELGQLAAFLARPRAASRAAASSRIAAWLPAIEPNTLSWSLRWLASG